MEKKTLNLDFVDLGKLKSNSEVSLMPCPCAESKQQYRRVTYGGAGGKSGVKGDIRGIVIGKAFDTIYNGIMGQAAICGAYQDAQSQAADCSYDKDYGGNTNDGPPSPCGPCGPGGGGGK